MTAWPSSLDLDTSFLSRRKRLAGSDHFPAAGTQGKTIRFDSAVISPDLPLQMPFNPATCPRHSRRAGKKCASPGFPSRLPQAEPSTSGNAARLRTDKRSIAGHTNNSNVPIVETGFPGKPTTACHGISKHAGFPDGSPRHQKKRIPAPMALSTL